MKRRIAPALAILALGSVLTSCFHKPFTLGRRANFSFSPEDLCNVQFYTSERILLRRSKASIPCADQPPTESGESSAGKAGVTASAGGSADTESSGGATTETSGEAAGEADASASVSLGAGATPERHATNCMSSGTLKMETVNRINEVRIKRGTPGIPLAVATFLNKKTQEVQVEYLLVGFSPSDPKKALWFSARDGAAGGKYVLERVATEKVLTGKDTEVRACPGGQLKNARLPGGRPLPVVGDGEPATMARIDSMSMQPAPVVEFGKNSAIYNLAEDEMWQVHLRFKERVILREDVERKTVPGWSK